VQRFINNEQADSLYNLMDANLKRQISSGQLNEFISDLIGQVGKWVSFEHQTSVNSVTEYRALFPLGVLRFYISQDTTGKIVQLSFVPESE